MKQERSFNSNPSIEVRATGGDGKPGKIVGYAIVWNSLSEVLYTRSGQPFRELIDRHAFSEFLSKRPSITMQVQHNGGLDIIGRTDNGSLTIAEDNHGLRFEVTPPDTSAGRDIQVLVRDGFINKCSFGFLPDDDEGALSYDFSGDIPIRTVNRARLFEISLVDTPAYSATMAEARSRDIEAIPATMEERSILRENEPGALRLYLYGVVVDAMTADLFGMDGIFSAADIVKAVGEAEDVQSMEVIINSPGGDAFEGIAIYNRLRELSKKGIQIRTRVEGLAASAASVVFLAGDERIVNDGAVVMIHGASSFTYGNAEDHMRTVTLLNQLNSGIADIMESRTRLSREDIDEMLSGEAWLSASDALEFGIATMGSDTLANVPDELEERVKKMRYRMAPDKFRGENVVRRSIDPSDVQEYIRRKLEQLQKG
jgi:ATP-dependent Clp protease protease subunit